MKDKKFKIIFGLIFVVVIIFFAYSALAAEVGIRFNVDFPRVPAPVPGKFLDLNCIEGQSNDFCTSDCIEGQSNDFCTADYKYLPNFKTLVLFIFSGAVWIAGLIAFGVLLYAGFLYIFAGSSPGNKGKAKEMFTNVVWGLGILLLSVVTLNLINPDITNLEDPFFTEIDEGEFDQGEDEDDGGDGDTLPSIQTAIAQCNTKPTDREIRTCIRDVATIYANLTVSIACTTLLDERVNETIDDIARNKDECTARCMQNSEMSYLPNDIRIPACRDAVDRAFEQFQPPPPDESEERTFVSAMQNACQTAIGNGSCLVFTNLGNSRVQCSGEGADISEQGCVPQDTSYNALLSFQDACDAYGNTASNFIPGPFGETNPDGSKIRCELFGN